MLNRLVKFSLRTFTLSFDGESAFVFDLGEKGSVTKTVTASPSLNSPYRDWVSLYEVISAPPEYQYAFALSDNFRSVFDGDVELSFSEFAAQAKKAMAIVKMNRYFMVSV